MLRIAFCGHSSVLSSCVVCGVLCHTHGVPRVYVFCDGVTDQCLYYCFVHIAKNLNTKLKILSTLVPEKRLCKKTTEG